MSSKKDLLGKKFSKWKVLEECGRNNNGSILWGCRCECGEEREVPSYALISGSSRSCGCLNKYISTAKEDAKRIGKKFGRWLVLSNTGKRTIHRDIIWECRCVCGTVKEIETSTLARGKVSSCGCYDKERRVGTRLHGDEAPFRGALSRYKGSARRRGLDWKIDKDFAYVLMKQNCYYCTSLPKNREKVKRAYGNSDAELIYNGIDRLDNSLGYVRGNVVSCCYTCNRAKNAMPIEDFVRWVSALCSSKTMNKLIEDQEFTDTYTALSSGFGLLDMESKFAPVCL